MKNFASKLSVENIVKFCKENGMSKEEINDLFQEFEEECKQHPHVISKEFLERIIKKVKGESENGTR